MKTNILKLLAGLAVIAFFAWLGGSALLRRTDNPSSQTTAEQRPPEQHHTLDDVHDVKARNAKIAIAAPNDQTQQPTDPTADMIIPQEFFSKHPNWRPPGHNPKSLYPGALPMDDVFDKYWGLIEWGGTHIIDPVGPDLDACRAAWEARGNKVTERMEWPMAIHIVGDGRRLEVVDVHTEKVVWPDSFTDEDKRCLSTVLLHRGEDSSVIADMTVDYNICFSVPEPPSL